MPKHPLWPCTASQILLPLCSPPDEQPPDQLSSEWWPRLRYKQIHRTDKRTSHSSPSFSPSHSVADGPSDNICCFRYWQQCCLLHRHELTETGSLRGRMVTEPDHCRSKQPQPNFMSTGKKTQTYCASPLLLNSYQGRLVLVSSFQYIFDYMFIFNYHSKESPGRKLRCQYYYLHHHCECSY